MAFLVLTKAAQPMVVKAPTKKQKGGETIAAMPKVADILVYFQLCFKDR